MDCKSWFGLIAGGLLAGAAWSQAASPRPKPGAAPASVTPPATKPAALKTPAEKSAAGKRKLTAEPVEGAEAFLELHYVPPERLTGDPELDHQMALNLYVPRDGKATHPVVILVHGGGYGGGDMNEGRGLYKPELALPLLQRGYAVVSLNYVLEPAGIFPQVFWDFRTAVRFLRANAEKYKLDPDLVGAVGFSAGGWLITSAGWTDADDILYTNTSCVGIEELAEKDWNWPKKKRPVLLPMDDPDPPYADQPARLSAISFDFSHMNERISPGDPATNLWCGAGFQPDWMEYVQHSGVDFSRSELTEDRYKGKGVHVPNLKSPTLPIEGEAPVALAERIAQFLDLELKQQPRALAPEMRPISRVFADRASVKLVAPKGYTLHYTTDGSDPSEKSKVYDNLFDISATTTVKAISDAPNRRPSGVSIAHFLKSPSHVPPTIVSPDGNELPKAKAGQPYQIAFRADGAGASARWELSGQLAPYVPFKQKELVYPLTLKLDPTAGVLSGTPDAPGRYWVQVQVAPAEGRLGTARSYVLTVEP